MAAAAPGLLPTSQLVYSVPSAAAVVQEPAYAKVGGFVKTVPGAVSHQSVSQVHSSAQVVHPYAATPLLKTTAYDAPLVPAYAATPLLHHPYGVHTVW